jgi:hypothetical protein
MPISDPVSVNDAITDVLQRAGFTSQGTATLTAQPRARTYLRQAMRELVGEATWDDLKADVRIPLTEGQDRYEYPEETYVGGILEVSVEDDRGRFWPIDGGIRRHDRMPTPQDTTHRVATGRPNRWRVVDKEIEVLPAPTAQYVNLVITFKRKLPSLNDGEDFLPFEPELLIQRATILMKLHYQKPGGSDDERSYRRYLLQRKRAQGEGRVFNVGGRKSHYVTRDKRVPRSGAYGEVGRGVSFTDGWNPW